MFLVIILLHRLLFSFENEMKFDEHSIASVPSIQLNTNNDHNIRDSAAAAVADGDNENKNDDNNICSLGKAVQCLTNALYLLRATSTIQPSSNSGIKPSSSSLSSNNNEFSTTMASSGSSRYNENLTDRSTQAPHRYDVLESAILLQLTYVNLVLGNFVNALSLAKEVHSQERLLICGKAEQNR